MNRVLPYRFFLTLLFFLAPLCLVAETQGTTGDFPASATSSLYTVKKGDCLWTIAKRLYKNPFKWPLLYRHNESLIQNPDQIEVGWKLSVPLSTGAEEVNQAIQFASDYKNAVRKGTHRMATVPTHKTVASTEKPSGGEVVGSNPVVPSTAPIKQEQPQTSSKPEESQAAPITPSQQPGGSTMAIIAVIILVLLAGAGIGWWKISQARKQEPYRMVSTAPTGTPEQPSTPPPAAEKPTPAMTPPSSVAQPAPQPIDIPPQVAASPTTPSSETPSQPVMPQPTVSLSNPEPGSITPPAQASAPITPPATPETGQTPPQPEGEKPKDENHRDVA
jgi:hypothetical protein